MILMKCDYLSVKCSEKHDQHCTLMVNFVKALKIFRHGKSYWLVGGVYCTQTLVYGLNGGLGEQ